jgi:uncharacterized membrane protein YhaH (DUF805 family)/DNA-binding XRE family transcriptional regulator
MTSGHHSEGGTVRVRELRLSRGWSQEELAERSGLSVRTIQRIEGGAPAGLESLRALAAALEVDVAELRSREGGPLSPMSFADSVVHSLRNYAEFDGLAPRREFWWFTLAVALVVALAEQLGTTAAGIATIALLLPWSAAAVRRLRDAGQSPWWLLMVFVPIGGLVALAFLLAMPSAADQARVGDRSRGVSRP